MLPVSIVIPIYKEELTLFELISLQQCYSILGNYPILFVCPKKMELGIFHKSQKNMGQFIFLDNKNFKSITTYNHMLLSIWFYKLFINYKYILIYQLDCFVFKDELMLWVEKGYSYIGAPWFLGNSNDKNISEFLGVGNGGFSLRNIKDFSKVLKSSRKIKSLNDYIIDSEKRKKSLYWLRGFKHYFKSNSFKNIYRNELVNEDKIFSIAGKRFDYFKIPDIKTAIAFAFELQPEKLYGMNNYQLPFGCHAWYKYDLKFYKPIIEKSGYYININEF